MAKWYYSEAGAIESDEGLGGLRPHLSVGGWHGPFPSKEAAFQFYVDNKDAHPNWHEPTDSAWQNFKNGLSDAGGGLASGIGDAIGISNGQINAGNWFIRIAEIVLGIVLIGVGVAKLTGTTNVISKGLKVL